MNITTRDEGPVGIISLQGKIMSDADVTEFMETVKACMYNNRSNLVVDFGEVDWINSSGLGMLIAAQNLLLEMNGGMRLARLNETVNKVIQMNKLNRIFEIHPTVDEAVASIK
jgi:anti-sigma B factor antagonist